MTFEVLIKLKHIIAMKNHTKKYSLVVAVIIVTLLSGLRVYAQDETYSQNNFSIHAGVAYPLSDFASEDINNDKAGGAATGFNIGLKYTYQLSDNGLGLFAGLDFNYNGLTKDSKNDIKELFESIGVVNADYTFFKYYNIPISAGLNYTYEANEKVDLFANAGLTFNLLKVSNFVIEADRFKITTEIDLANSIGFKIGGGILINKKMSIAIDYWGLGNHNLNGESKGEGLAVRSEEIDAVQKVDLFTMTLGYNF